MYHDIAPYQRRDTVGFPGPLAGRYKLEPDTFAKHLDALAAKVLELLGDKRRWGELRAGARRFVETERNWTSSVGRYRQPYYRLTGEVDAAYGRA